MSSPNHLAGMFIRLPGVRGYSTVASFRRAQTEKLSLLTKSLMGEQ